jgi:release factor glutamine methyltransferase
VTIDELLADGERQLKQAGIDTARLDAELLVGEAVSRTRLELYRDRGHALSEAEVAAARGLLDRRARREPVAYILGEWGFRRLTLKVDRRVLVPRPETEVVVGRCLELLRGAQSPVVLDVGTGSGAIALAIADEHPGADVIAIDVSEDALALARENARATGLAVRFERHDLTQGLSGSYDLVVSNPPYVSVDEIETVEPEVRDWEPRLATVGDTHTEAIAAAARGVLQSGGWLVLEVAAGHGERVASLLRELGYDAVTTSQDLAGRDRVVEGRWAPSTRP